MEEKKALTKKDYLKYWVIIILGYLFLYLFGKPLLDFSFIAVGVIWLFVTKNILILSIFFISVGIVSAFFNLVNRVQILEQEIEKIKSKS